MERESVKKSLIAAVVIIIVVLTGYFFLYTPKTADNGSTSNVTTTSNTNGSLNTNSANKTISESSNTNQVSSNSNGNNLNDSNNTGANGNNSTASGISSNDNVKSISSIDQSWKGNKVTVSAVVIKKYDSNKNGRNDKCMTIADPNRKTVTMKAVLFDADKNSNTAALLDSAYKNGTPINISGKINVYKGELEIVVKNVGN